MIPRGLAKGAARGARAMLARALGDRTGSTAVEFALVAPIFVGLAMATLQSAVIWFAKTELQAATETAARLVFTRQSATYASQATFQTQLCNNLPALINCNNVVITLTPQVSISAVSTSPPPLTYSASGALTNTGTTFSPGVNGQVMVLQVFYQLPVVAGPLFDFATQPNGTLQLVSTVVFQNEPT
jgi:Flp pilus assembly protein TadG